MNNFLKIIIYLVPPIIILTVAILFYQTPPAQLPLIKPQLTQKLSQLSKLEQEFGDLQKAGRQLEADLSFYNYKPGVFGDEIASPTQIFRNMVDKQIKASALMLRSLSDVQQIIIPDSELTAFELNIAAEGSTEEMAEFLKLLYDSQPRIFTKNLSLRSSSNGAKDILTLNAVLAIFVIGAENAK
ncbi:MAG: hypothetical protein RRY34_10295 [Victivallaceae bacterium]